MNPSKALSKLDDIISRLGRINVSAPRRHAGVLFDPRADIGGVPDAANIDYRGFMAYMTPREFRLLTPPRSSRDNIDFLGAAAERGDAIGNPMLYVRPFWKKRGSAPERYDVSGHEGRGRMLALEERLDTRDALYPVGIHPLGEVRARHMDQEWLFRGLAPEPGRVAGKEFFIPRLSVLGGVPYVRPGLEGDEMVLRALQELGSDP